MKVKDLAVGVCYHGKYYETNYIFILDNLFKLSIQHHIKINSYRPEFYGAGNFGNESKLCELRLATYEETEWLYDCIRNGKMVPKKVISEFKAGDYIVLLNKNGLNHKANRCYKQRINSSNIRSCVDDSLSTNNGSDLFKFDIKENWRYATQEEIAEYERLERPYDVTTLQSSSTFIHDGVTYDRNKWYTSNAWLTKSYCKIETIDYRDVHCSEYILKDTYNHNGIKWNCSLSSLREVDLSEVQQYLPEDHVDKISNKKDRFKVGQWYKNLGSLQDHAGKFLGWWKDNNDHMSVSEYIAFSNNCHGYYYNSATSENFASPTGYAHAEECSLEEIQQYLPEDHKDKMKKSRKEMIIDEAIKRGLIEGVTIKTVTNLTRLLLPGNYLYYPTSNNLAWEPMDGSIKQGLYENGKWATLEKSVSGTIVNHDKWCIRVTKDQTPKEVFEWRTNVKKRGSWASHGYIHSDGYWAATILENHHEITLEQFRSQVLFLRKNDPYKPESTDFKVGDYCYVLDSGSSQLSKNKVYKINDIIPGNWHFDIDGTDNKNNRCWLNKNDFRLATNEEVKISSYNDIITIKPYVPTGMLYYADHKYDIIIKSKSQQKPKTLIMNIEEPIIIKSSKKVTKTLIL